MKQLQKNLDYLSRIHPDLDVADAKKLTIDEIQAIAEKFEIPFNNLILYNLEARALAWDKVKFVFLDVDGVMTEGGMFYTEEGSEFKRFDTKDGMAIKEAMKAGIEFGIISSGINERIIKHRADMFGIKHVYVGAEPKRLIAEKWLEKLDISWNECAYIGDDINDLQMFELVGIAACPADASNPNKNKASFLLQSNGGHGCVREFLGHHPLLIDRL